MDCPKHEQMVKDIQQIKHNEQSNMDKIHNNEEHIKELNKKLTDLSYNRISDHRDMKNMEKLLESINSKLDRWFDKLEEKVINVDSRLSKLENNFAVNDYKTDHSTKELTKVNSVIRELSGVDVLKIIGIMIAFGGLVVSVIQAVGG